MSTSEIANIRFVKFDDLCINELENQRVAKQAKGDREKWESFKSSIKAGMIHFPTAVQIGDKLHLDTGFRRVMAAKENGDTGCICHIIQSKAKDASGEAIAHIGRNVVENLQRHDLDWTELCAAVDALAQRGLKNKEIEERLSMTSGGVSQYRTIASCKKLFAAALKRFASGKPAPSKNEVYEIAKTPDADEATKLEMYNDALAYLDTPETEDGKPDGKKSRQSSTVKPRKAPELMQVANECRNMAKNASSATERARWELADSVLRWVLYPKTHKAFPLELPSQVEEEEESADE
jgi:hypothetical protein